MKFIIKIDSKTMGCSGSAAGNAGVAKGKKVDDNKVLRDAGLQPLDKNQCTLFNAWFAAVCAACKPKEGEAGSQHQDDMMDMLKDDEATVAAQKHKYEQADEDMDGKLNCAECQVFLKNLLGEGSPCCSDEIIDKWNKSMASLDATSGAEHNFEDFCRSKKILAAWIASPKGDCLRPAPAAPEQKPAAQAAAAQPEDAQVNDMQ